jgi:4-hydroxybenzoate polyprenyltransferase
MSQLAQRISQYLSLIAFSHTVFALPFALIGFFLGVNESGSSPDIILLTKVLACMVFARTAAMAFNRYLDRDFDKLNPRTAGREIPAGVISARSALIFVVISSLLFVATTWFINEICFYLSPVALLVVLGYSYTKRFTWLCHFVLGVGLALAPIGAYLAITGEFAWMPLLFSFVVFTWVSGFDLIYALQDEEFDRNQHLKSIPVSLGKAGALHVSSILHAITAGLIFFAGRLGGFGLLYWAGASVFLMLLVYQHSIVKPHDLSRVNRAFGTTNGYASVLFCLGFLLDFFVRN